jgi:hypothetical protein
MEPNRLRGRAARDYLEAKGALRRGEAAEEPLDPLRGEWDGSCSSESARQLGEHGQVGVEPDPLDPTDPERQ